MGALVPAPISPRLGWFLRVCIPAAPSAVLGMEDMATYPVYREHGSARPFGTQKMPFPSGAIRLKKSSDLCASAANPFFLRFSSSCTRRPRFPVAQQFHLMIEARLL